MDVEHFIEFADELLQSGTVTPPDDGLLIAPPADTHEVPGVLLVAQEDRPGIGIDLGDGRGRQIAPGLGELVFATRLCIPVAGGVVRSSPVLQFVVSVRQTCTALAPTDRTLG